MDANFSQGYLEVDLEKDMTTPKTMQLMILLGVRGAEEGKDKDRDLGQVEHVAFRFDYNLAGWDAVSSFVVPPEAQKILR